MAPVGRARDDALMPKPRPSLALVLDLLKDIAPLELAADWDNVGLLLEPSRRAPPIARVLLTIDLTEAVVAEAARMRADLVVAYHPPIFHGMKQLRASDARQRAVLAALAAGLFVYSPHTALDAAPAYFCPFSYHLSNNPSFFPSLYLHSIYFCPFEYHHRYNPSLFPSL